MEFVSSPMQNAEISSSIKIDENEQRRTANYKPNIWNYDLFQSLSSEYLNEEHKAKAEKLKEEVKCMISKVNMIPLSKLELIDSTVKLGLSSYFEKEIREALETIGATQHHSGIKEDLYATSLCFRLLRQFGYNPSQDSFLGFVDDTGKFLKSAESESTVKAWIELFEASNLGGEGEELMHEARLYATECLRKSFGTNSDQHDHSKQAAAINAILRLPLHWRGEWYNIKAHINAHQNDHYNKSSSTLVELAKLNFNILQATQQEDLKDITRWWVNLGVIEKLRFCRDRMVESFMYAGGVAFEPQYGSLRKWLSKVIKLVLIIDDIFDVYGSLDELECFSNAVDSWKTEEVNELPECMKICFWMLSSTIEEMAVEIQMEKGRTTVLPYLKKAWSDFCKSLLVEAKWYNKGYTPSLEEYLENGWISSSGPLLSLHIILATANTSTNDNVQEILRDNQELIHYTSLIIRLCNDQGTSAAEVERGDAPSSIVCYMRESKVSEEEAREHIRSIIIRTWKKINDDWMRRNSNRASFSGEPGKYIINTARVAHFIYHQGDGFGVQDRREVLSNLIQPALLLIN